LLTVAFEVRDFDGPTLVFGDLNDVAWSPTTALFQAVSAMLDPRIGRGQFNTFHARWPWLRYSLDHIFVSNHFRLVSLKRLPYIGSDHFPILAEFALDFLGQQSPQASEEPEANEEDLDEAIHRVAKADELQREPADSEVGPMGSEHI
jgi:hypothetical protein